MNAATGQKIGIGGSQNIGGLSVTNNLQNQGIGGLNDPSKGLLNF